VLSVAGTLDGGTIPPELILPSSEIFALIGKTLFPSGCGRRILPVGRRRAARRWYGDTGGVNTWASRGREVDRFGSMVRWRS
jgi:hypothetical protein